MPVRLIFFFLLFSPYSSHADVGIKDLIGTWKSLESATIKDMEAHSDDMPKEVLDVLQDNFYGKLVTIIEENRAKSFTLGTEQQESAEWYPYEVLESSGNYFKVRYRDPWSNEWETSEWLFHGDRISTETRWGFREYFEKIQ